MTNERKAEVDRMLQRYMQGIEDSPEADPRDAARKLRAKLSDEEMRYCSAKLRAVGEEKLQQADALAARLKPALVQ